MTDFSMDEQGLSVQTTFVTDVEEQHKVDLLEQFYLTLRVMYLSAPKAQPSVVHERIEKLFKGDQSWRNAYEIEQLLCFILSDAQIEIEFKRRLSEARALKLEYVDAIDKELNEIVAGRTPDKRILLHRLFNDLQWFYSKRVQRRSASKRLMWRSSLLFMVALVILFLVLFIQFFAHAPAAAANTPPAAAAAPVASPGV